MTKIINIGSINIDYVYAVPHFLRAGETLAANERAIFAGGKGLNQSVALALAGGDVTHAGMIGHDGLQAMKFLKNKGVDIRFIKQSKIPTGHTIIQVVPEGQNCILLYPGANREIDENFVDETLSHAHSGDILLLQNEVSCTAYAMEEAHKKGIRIAFNPSPMDAKIMQFPLELVTWFLLNEIEGNALTGQTAPAEILSAMSETYPDATTVLTLGEHGVLCFDKGRVYQQEAYKVNAVDTTAAGDTFTGYFIRAIAAGEGVAEALVLASRAAAITVSRQGAAASIPTMEEVLDAIEREMRAR